MSRMLLVLLGVLSISLLGCGEKPAGGEGAEGDRAGDAGEGQDGGSGQAEEFVLETPDLEVGQWISYGVDAEPGVVTISAVAEENFSGSDCVWIQVEVPGDQGDQTVFQILVDPVLMAGSMEGYTGMMNEFMEDPAAWVEQYHDTQSMLMDPEGIEKMISFISALKMVKLDQGGQVMAFDLSGVPAVIQSMVEDSAFIAQMQSGMEMNAQTGQMDSLRTIMEQSEFSFEPGTVQAGGSTIECMTFSMEHEKGSIEISFSTELPILPLARVALTSREDSETHVLEVRDFGMEGAENLLPGAPVQVVDAAQFLQMMMAQAQSQPAPQQSRGMRQGIR
ncbi:hypothetical protein GX411_04360 [Candidatus Fermentibacteria bacterium]|nr:hypothetical protein [Candidatus Fermentibacteria bacterium]